MKCFWVYIITNKYNTVLYTGLTNDLSTRLWEHREKRNPQSFSAHYKLFKLIYFESFEWQIHAVRREKYIKGKTRQWKNELIKKFNPEWLDLTNTI